MPVIFILRRLQFFLSSRRFASNCAYPGQALANFRCTGTGLKELNYAGEARQIVEKPPLYCATFFCMYVVLVVIPISLRNCLQIQREILRWNPGFHGFGHPIMWNMMYQVVSTDGAKQDSPLNIFLGTTTCHYNNSARHFFSESSSVAKCDSAS